MKQLQSTVMITNPSKKVAISIYNQISSISEMMRKFTVCQHVITAVKNRTEITCGKFEIHQES